MAGVVELVLHDAVEHVGEVVALAGDAVSEARVGQRCDGFLESVVGAFGLRDGFAPCGFGGFRDQRKIVGARGLIFLAREAH